MWFRQLSILNFFVTKALNNRYIILYYIYIYYFLLLLLSIYCYFQFLYFQFSTSFEKYLLEKDIRLLSMPRKDSITFHFVHTLFFLFQLLFMEKQNWKYRVRSCEVVSYNIRAFDARLTFQARSNVRFWFDLLVIRGITKSEKTAGPFDRQRRTCINFYSYHKAGKSVVSRAIGPSHAQMSIS